MNIKYTLPIILLIILGLFSCPKKIDEPVLATLEATWNLKPECKLVSSTSSLKIKQVFRATTFEETATVFSDTGCLNAAITLVASGSYLTSNMRTDIFDERADLDSTLYGYLVTPNSSVVVSDYNSTAYCGFNDWQLGVAKSVLGRLCSGITMPSTGTVEYSFYVKVKQQAGFDPPGAVPTVAGDLYFGTGDSTHNGTSASQRYNIENRSYIYVK